MTRQELVKTLKIIADMGDKQIETLANALIDYFSSETEQNIGFRKDDK